MDSHEELLEFLDGQIEECKSWLNTADKFAVNDQVLAHQDSLNKLLKARSTVLGDIKRDEELEMERQKMYVEQGNAPTKLDKVLYYVCTVLGSFAPAAVLAGVNVWKGRLHHKEFCMLGDIEQHDYTIRTTAGKGLTQQMEKLVDFK